MQVFNGLKQSLTEYKTTRTHVLGRKYKDEKDNVYRYNYISGYISAAFNTVIVSMVNGSTCTIKRADVGSLTIGDGGLLLGNAASGTYGFTLIEGLGDCYVESSCAVGATLQGNTSTAGLLQAKAASPVAELIAKCMETGAGALVATEVRMMINK